MYKVMGSNPSTALSRCGGTYQQDKHYGGGGHLLLHSQFCDTEDPDDRQIKEEREVGFSVKNMENANKKDLTLDKNI